MDVRAGGQDRVDPVQGRAPPLDEVGDPAQRHHRPHEQAEVADEGHEVARRDREQDGLAAAEKQDERHAQVGEQHHHREEGARDPHQAQVLVDIGPGGRLDFFGLGRLAVVGLDQADAGDTLTDRLRQIRERGLHRPVAAVHPAAEKARGDGDERHRDEDKAGQGGVDVDHEADGGRTHDHGVVQGHQAHAGGHADLLDVVRGVGHEVARAGAVEIGGGKGLQMVKQAVAQALLDAAGCAQQAQPPDVAKRADQNGDAGDGERIVEQPAGVDAQQGEVVDRPLDHPGDDELQHVHEDQADQADQNPVPVLREIRLDY